MIRLFAQNVLPVRNVSTGRWEWSGLGLGIISDAISCFAEEERNGKYELTMEYPVNGFRYDEMKINNIIVTRPNHSADEQGFRIYQVSKSFEKVITVKAEHISYQLSHIPALPFKADSCAHAMDALFNSNNTTEECPFEGYTDKSANYGSNTSGTVVTSAYQGRYLEFSWTITSATSSSVTIDWSLLPKGQLSGYSDGWVMCGPITLKVGGRTILNAAYNHPNRLVTRVGKFSTDTSGQTIVLVNGQNVTINFGTGTTSLPIELSAYMYYDYDKVDQKQGLITGTGAIIPKSSESGESGDNSGVGEFEIDTPTSVRSVVGGGNNSLLSVYGGEVEWDNLTVKLLASRGTDNGVTIRYGKNLTSLEQEETIAETYTGITPYWKGTEPESNAIVVVTLTHILVNGSAISTIPDTTETITHTSETDSLHSDNADNYPYQRTLPMDFTSTFSELQQTSETSSDSTKSQKESFWEKVPRPDDLLAVAEAWLEISDIGVPEVNLNIAFVPLWQTEEYKDIALLEEVSLCDTVTVIFEDLDVNASAKVTKTKYDCLLERYDSIDLSSTGKLKATLASTIAAQPTTIEAAMSETESVVLKALDDATARITGASGGQIKYLTDNNGEPYEMFIAGDPNSDGTYGNYIRLNKEGIGFSTQGFNGPFNSAWTIDGKFNAQYITAFTFNSDKIYTGLQQSQNYEAGVSGVALDWTNGVLSAPTFTITTGQVDGLDTEIQNGAQLVIDQSGIVQTVTDIQTELNNLGGGTNLIRGTRQFSGWVNSASRPDKWSLAASNDDATFTRLLFADETTSSSIRNSFYGSPWTPIGRLPRVTSEDVYLTISFEILIRSSYGDITYGDPLDTNFCRVCMSPATTEPTTYSGYALSSLYYSYLKNFENIPKNRWVRLSFTTPKLGSNEWSATQEGASWSNVNYFGLYFCVRNNGYVAFRKLKVETGQTATAWSPAPEDEDAEFAAVKYSISQVEQTATNITQTIGTADTPNTILYAINELNDSVDDIQSDIGTSSTSGTIKGNINELIGDVAAIENDIGDAQTEGTIKYQISQIDQRADGIELSLSSKIESSSLVYTGLNLVPRSRTLTNWEFGGSDLIVKDSSDGDYREVRIHHASGDSYPSPFRRARPGYIPKELFVNTEITFSFDVFLPGTISGITNYSIASILLFQATDSGYSQVGSLGFASTWQEQLTKTNEWLRLHTTTDLSSISGWDNATHVMFTWQLPEYGWIYFRKMQVELGSEASGWTPSPSDAEADSLAEIDTAVTELRGLIIDEKGITGIVSTEINTSLDTALNDPNTGVQTQINTINSTITTMNETGIKAIVTQEITGLKNTQSLVQSWFSFTTNGLTIGKTGSEYKTKITNEAFAIKKGSSTVGKFTAEGLTTGSVILDTSMTLDKMVLSAYASGWVLSQK